VLAEERRVEVGVNEAWQLVRYRLTHVFALWLDAIGPHRAQLFAAEAEAALGGAMGAVPAHRCLPARARPPFRLAMHHFRALRRFGAGRRGRAHRRQTGPRASRIRAEPAGERTGIPRRLCPIQRVRWKAFELTFE
jgi:hypothetical protein